MKKRLIVIGTIFIFALIGCGSEDSSKEAKELLQRILTLVGIPQEMVINVCQDNNANNLCEKSEVLAKVSVFKDDSVSTIWEKIEFDKSNSYWLDKIDPSKKLLLVMQDTDNVKYDDGKFALPFTINKSKENNSTKEVSILESMVDEGYLKSSEVVAVKKMNSVDKFYDILLKDLMKNFNTLKDKALSSSKSILENLKYMASELRKNGISKAIPDSVNACGDNEACVNTIIAKLFKNLEITASEAEVIAGVDSNDDPTNDNDKEPKESSSKKTIDFADYLPNSDMEKVYTEYLDGKSYKYGATIFEHKDRITREKNIIKYLGSHNYQGYENSWQIDDEESQLLIKNETIDYIHESLGDIKPYSEMFRQEVKRVRYLNIGDISFSSSFDMKDFAWDKTNCTITKKLTSFSHREHSYSGNIIEEKCIRKGKNYLSAYKEVPERYDIFFNYYQKEIGFIASIDNNCHIETVVQDGGKVTVSTSVDSEGCDVNNMQYIYYKN
jgi:hypothetical protein